MFDKRGIRAELRWLALVIAASTIVGYSFEAVSYFVIGGLISFILWLFYRVSALESWVAKARRYEAPADDFGGIWGEIADDVRLLRKRYEKDKIRLQTVVSRVQDMTSALPDGVVLIDTRSNIEWWNRAAQSFIDFRDIDRGQRMVNIVRHPRFVAYFEQNEYDKPLILESLMREGQHLEFHIHPFGQGERLIIVRDITRVQRLELMRKDFVSNVSHELRTPLTVLKGYIETLQDAPQLAPNWQKPLSQMHHQCNRMTALVNDLITLSRLETDQTEKHQTVNLATLAQGIISDARALSGENYHNIEFHGDAGIALLGDERELHSAISNLIFNAVKYSPENSTIKVALRSDSNGCSISVKDDGPGMDPKHIPRLTERFYRIDESRSSAMGGTGLGLAIVKHVLMRHDGELKIESHLGQGSTFTCHFPQARVANKKVA